MDKDRCGTSLALQEQESMIGARTKVYQTTVTFNKLYHPEILRDKYFLVYIICVLQWNIGSLNLNTDFNDQGVLNIISTK